LKELTLKLSCWIDAELKDYLLQLKGITQVNIDKEQDIINILYDSKHITIYIIIKEIEFFLRIDKVPSLVSFNKHSKQEVTKYEINIEDFCCEYCLRSNIEKLLLVDGIESATVNIDFKYDTKANIKLSYNNKLIKEEQIKSLEDEFDL